MIPAPPPGAKPGRAFEPELSQDEWLTRFARVLERGGVVHAHAESAVHLTNNPELIWCKPELEAHDWLQVFEDCISWVDHHPCKALMAVKDFNQLAVLVALGATVFGTSLGGAFRVASHPFLRRIGFAGPNEGLS